MVSKLILEINYWVIGSILMRCSILSLVPNVNLLVYWFRATKLRYLFFFFCLYLNNMLVRTFSCEEIHSLLQKVTMLNKKKFNALYKVVTSWLMSSCFKFLFRYRGIYCLVSQGIKKLNLLHIYSFKSLLDIYHLSFLEIISKWITITTDIFNSLPLHMSPHLV